MNVNLTPNITGKNVNIIKGATQADLTNSVNNSKIYRDEAEAFSIVSEAKSVEASYSALNASISATTAIDKAIIATTKANEANNSAINASASEAVCIAKATITTDKANIATAQSVIATDKANEASVSANTATTQAGISTTKASEASISASNALTSENNADTSEANALIYRNQAESFANSINTGDIVHISGTETITGNKTFTGTVTLPSTTSIGTVSSTELGYLDGVTSGIQTQLNVKAPLASPALTGTPTAPTAAVGTNTTQLATTAYVKSEVTNETYTKAQVDSKLAEQLVGSIAELKLIDGSTVNKLEVLGYYEKGDGGGGTFYWDATSTETDNGGTIIQATGITTGRWKRVYSGAINVKCFGAKGDGITDDSINIQRAIDYSLSSGKYEPIYFNGIFVLYETLKYDGFVSLIGEKDAANGNTTQFYCYNPNCTLDIGFFNANPFSLAFSIKNISFVQKAPFVGTKKSILYVDSISSFELKNVQFHGYNELSNGTAINMVNTSNNMDLVKLDGVQLNFFENGIWLNRLDNSQSFAGHIYNIAGIGCKYYIRISGGAAFYNGSILANHITYNGNTENIIYIERGSLTNSEVKLYMESTSNIDLDGCVINLGSYIENYISGDISAYVGGDGFTDFITQRKILVSNMDLIGYNDFYCYQNYPNPITMTSNIHSSKRVQSYGVKSQNKLIFNNGYISRDYYPDDIVSNKIGIVNTLINNKAPVLDTQSLSKGIKKYGRVKATAQANSEVLKFNTIDLFSTFISASNTIPEGTIGMRVKRTQLTASRINQTLFSSSDVDNSAFKFLFRSCTNYNEMSFQTDYSTSSTVNKSPSNWRLPFEREIIIYIKWNSTSTTVYWDGYKVKYNEAPKFGNFIYFGNSFMVNNESFCGSIYDISVWNTELPTSIIESFYLNDTKWS